MPKIAIFADVQNIYYTTQHAFGRKFDYRRLWQRIQAGGDIVIANAYAIERGDSQQMKFQNALRSMGFTVKLKPFIQRRDGSAKGDWDVGITIDALDAADQVDEVVLLSGDGDFDLLLLKLASVHKVKSTVFGVRTLTAGSLIAAADRFNEIDTSLLI